MWPRQAGSSLGAEDGGGALGEVDSTLGRSGFHAAGRVDCEQNFAAKSINLMQHALREFNLLGGAKNRYKYGVAGSS